MPTDNNGGGGDRYGGSISNVSGQAAIGRDITQTNTEITLSAGPTQEQLQQLAAAFASLKDEVSREAPPEVHDEAVRQAEVLEQATTGPKPDVSAMASVRRWFLDHAPKLLGAVTAVIVNPIVGTIVKSAGDAIASEYQRHFPEATEATP